MKIQTYNGSKYPQKMIKDDLPMYREVWIDGVLSPNPFFLTIDEVVRSFDVAEVSATKKWGVEYNLEISKDGECVHSLSLGFSVSEYVARVLKMKTYKDDSSDGFLPDVESSLITDFRKKAVIKLDDYKALA